MFRVVVHTPASTLVQLNLEEGDLALEVTRKALQCMEPPNHQGNIEEGNLEGWRLRARRVVEEGRWWSENGINEYSDRKFGPACLHQADMQLYWAVTID